MFYPYRESYLCEYCKKGTKKWKALEFHSTYTLGMNFCDNPNCPESYDSYMSPFKAALNIIKSKESK